MLKMKNILICVLFIVFLFFKGESAQPACATKYNVDTLPINCTANACNFLSLLPLINGSSPANQSVFVLCIILPTYKININSNQMDSIPYSVYIQCFEFATTLNYTLITFNSFVVKAISTINFNSFQLSAQTVWVQAAQGILIENNTKIINNSYLNSQCSCSDQRNSSCTFDDSFSFPNLYQQDNLTNQFINIASFLEQVSYQSITFNSVILFSLQKITIQSSQLISSVIGVFTLNAEVQNVTLQTTGNGYSSNYGYGCGYFDQILNQLLGCSGSGGSYGGFGGNSYPDNCALMISRTPYGSSTYPSSPGSGGGFFLSNVKDVSSGGGIINIQVQNITLANSKLISNGKDGKQGGGGGSGGTVSIQYSNVFGSGVVNAVGGNGKSSGSGGRIRIWNHNWKSTSQNQSSLNDFSISAMGGQQCAATQGLNCGESGTIISSPCMPGFELNLITFSCDACQVGFYQSLYGYSSCLPCANKPAYAQYTNQNSHEIYEGACQFTCIIGYTEADGRCLSQFQNIMRNIGGINTLVSLGIIVGVAIAYLVIILIQKLTAKQYFLFSQRKNQDQYQRKMHFKVQDIPYHQLRIYLSGSNSLQSPWYIPQQTKKAFQKVAIHPITKISSLINKTFKQINQQAQYTKLQKVLIYFLYVYYYPMAFYVLNKFKENRSLNIYKSIIQINKKIPEFQTLGIKFHVQPYHSVGCIEIFNYTKSSLDFYIQNYFPIYFQIQKLPMGGYTIDLNDPFMKAFIMEIDQKSQKKMYQKFLIELDELLRNSKQLVPILKHLWMMSQHKPNIQVYLYQPSDAQSQMNGVKQGRVLGVNKQISIDNKSPLFLVFSSQNIDTHHFIYESDLDCIYYDKVNHFKHQFNFRREVIQDDKKAIFLEIQNQLSQKILSWALGILTIILLLECVMSFFMIIFILAEQNVNFNYAIFVYFLLAPFNQFFMVFMNFKLILSKNPKVISYSIYFTITNIIKFFALTIMALFQTISLGFSNILVSILFYLWIISVVCNIISLFLQLLLHPHYSKHNSQEKHVFIKND